MKQVTPAITRPDPLGAQGNVQGDATPRKYMPQGDVIDLRTPSQGAASIVDSAHNTVQPDAVLHTVPHTYSPIYSISHGMVVDKV